MGHTGYTNEDGHTLSSHTQRVIIQREDRQLTSWDMYWEGYGTVKGVKMELHPVADSGKPAWVHDTWTKTGLGALRMRKSSQTDRAGSPTLNGEGHDRAEKLQDNNAGGTERQGGEEPKTKPYAHHLCATSVTLALPS